MCFLMFRTLTCIKLEKGSTILWVHLFFIYFLGVGDVAKSIGRRVGPSVHMEAMDFEEKPMGNLSLGANLANHRFLRKNAKPKAIS